MRRVLAIVVAAGLLLASASADARRRRRHHHHHHAARPVYYTNNRTFGLGLIVGGPTGLSGKLYMSDSFALDFALGWYYGWHDEGIGAHVDLLWHPVLLASGGGVDIPLYLGVGGRVADDRWGRFHEDSIDVGVRVPFGIAFEFNQVPLDIFLELALLVDFIDEDGDRVGLDGAFGLRYWF